MSGCDKSRSIDLGTHEPEDPEQGRGSRRVTVSPGRGGTQSGPPEPTPEPTTRRRRGCLQGRRRASSRPPQPAHARRSHRPWPETRARTALLHAIPGWVAGSRLRCAPPATRRDMKRFPCDTTLGPGLRGCPTAVRRMWAMRRNTTTTTPTTTTTTRACAHAQDMHRHPNVNPRHTLRTGDA